MLVDSLAAEPDTLARPPQLDPGRHHRGDAVSTLSFIVTLDAINFGSGWFPHLNKRPGCSGYFTMASCLTDRFDQRGPPSTAELAAITRAECAALFEQDLAVPEQAELMGLFERALSDLGRFVEERFGGRFEDLVAAADGSAARLVDTLQHMPLYRDVSEYHAMHVPFYKRAQLTAADLAAAFEQQGPGSFRDLDRLTIFADNLVPHVLRREGVLVYDAALAARIDRGELVAAGSAEEVEIRAVALDSVEQIVANLAARGIATTSQALDFWLWNRGQRPDMKAHPRHRARSVYY